MHKNIRLLSWFNFFSDFVFFAPVAIIYFAQITGSYAVGMSIFSIAYLSSAAFEVPTGIISDIIGRKKTVIFGALASCACVILYALAGNFWMLALGALMQGISRSFYSGNNDALLHDTLKESGKEHKYHEYLGRTSAMFQVALAIAAAIGSIMAANSFTLVMWASVLPQLIALILAFQLVEPSVVSARNTNIYGHLRESLDEFRKNYKLRLLTTASVLRFGLGESTFFLRSTFINGLWPLWAIGISYSFSHIGGALSYYYSGRVIDKHKPLRVLNFEILFNRTINFVALLFPTVVSPALMSMSSLTYGVGSVAMNALLQREFTQNQRATMSSLASFAGSIAFGFFAWVMGTIADYYDPRTAMIVAHILLLSPLLFYRLVFHHDNEDVSL